LSSFTDKISRANIKYNNNLPLFQRLSIDCDFKREGREGREGREQKMRT
jgi:hypothetical protein